MPAQTTPPAADTSVSDVPPAGGESPYAVVKVQVPGRQLHGRYRRASPTCSKRSTPVEAPANVSSTDNPPANPTPQHPQRPTPQSHPRATQNEAERSKSPRSVSWATSPERPSGATVSDRQKLTLFVASTGIATVASAGDAERCQRRQEPCCQEWRRGALPRLATSCRLWRQITLPATKTRAVYPSDVFCCGAVSFLLM